MKTFDVYNHPTQGYQAVKQGFAWPAFFFTVIWAFIKKMWGPGLGFLGLNFLLLFLSMIFEEVGSGGGVFLMLLGQLALYVCFGLYGNNWRRSNLKKRGFEVFCTVGAHTPDAAIGEAVKRTREL